MSELERFLKKLEKCGDLAIAEQRAGVSDALLTQLFSKLPKSRRSANPEILRQIMLARVKAQLRKNLRAPLMEPKRFAEAVTA